MMRVRDLVARTHLHYGEDRGSSSRSVTARLVWL